MFWLKLDDRINLFRVFDQIRLNILEYAGVAQLARA